MTSSGLARVVEGTTELLVPGTFCKKGPGKRTGEVFYNRQMEFGRDVSVMFGRAVFGEGEKILDGLAASGARGLRLANETGVRADFVLNDRNLAAAVLMKENASANSLDHVRVTCKDLRTLLSEEQFDHIDIDPFGTPVDFVNAAMQSCRNKGTVAVTATDTAPLYGTYPRTSLRRYGALSARSPFAHETGLRILIGFLVREAARHDRACEPLLCFHTDHYFRCCVRVVNGAARADAAVKKLGFAHFDKDSLDRRLLAERVDKADAGPLWTGALLSGQLLDEMKVTKDLGTATRCEKYLSLWQEEASAPALFFKLDELARRTKHSPPKLQAMVAKLAEGGFSASRTHFDPKGVKTDAPLGELLQLYKDC